MKKYLSFIICAVIAITASAAVGDVFTANTYFNFQITQEYTNSQNGKVKLVGLTTAGKNIDGFYPGGGASRVPGVVVYSNKYYDVDAVAAHAFAGSKSLTVEFDYGVTTFESYAFENSKLYFVYLPSSAKTIQAYAFKSDYLQHMRMSSPTPPTTHANAFDGKQSNYTLGLSNNGANIVPLYKAHSVYGSFKSVTKMKELGDNFMTVNDANGNPTIKLSFLINKNAQGVKVFSIGGATELSTAKADYEVNFPATSAVSAINDSAFMGLSKAKSLDLRNFQYVKSVGKSAFRGLNVTYLRLPSSVETIESYAFKSCTKLTEVVIPEHCNSVALSFVDGCTSMTDISAEEGNTTYGSYYGQNYIGTTTSYSMLYNCNGETLIRCPEGIPSTACLYSGVKYIGNWSFDGCKNLSNVRFPYGTKTIGNSAFANCTNLVAIEVPSSVTEISNNAFSTCTALQNVYMTTYTAPTCYENTFPTNDALRLYYPNATGYSSATFTGKTGFTKFTEYGSSQLAFDFVDKALNSYVVRNQPGNGTYGDAILTKIELSVQEYKPGMFVYNDRLESSGTNYQFYLIMIGGSACAKAGSGVPALKTLDLSGATHLGQIGNNAFNGCSNLTSVKLNEELAVIRKMAFYGCSKISSLVIPDNVVSVEQEAFAGCSVLKTLTIGRKVKTIGANAFDNSLSMDIYARMEDIYNVTMGSNVFAKVNKYNSTLYVPKGHNYEYMQADQWKDFYDIEEKDYGFNTKTGDVDGNGVVDITDANILINIVLGKASASSYGGRANVDGKGDVDISDINAVLNIILGK